MNTVIRIAVANIIAYFLIAFFVWDLAWIETIPDASPVGRILLFGVAWVSSVQGYSFKGFK